VFRSIAKSLYIQLKYEITWLIRTMHTWSIIISLVPIGFNTCKHPTNFPQIHTYKQFLYTWKMLKP
jgi:hypothetical protein